MIETFIGLSHPWSGSRLPVDIKLKQYWTYSFGRVKHSGNAGLLEPCSTKTVQTSEFRPAQTKPRKHFTNIGYLQSFCCLETTVLKNKRPFFSPSEYITRLEEKYFPRNNCISLPVDNSNVELMKHIVVHMGVRLFVGNRGSGQRFFGSKKSDP